MIEMDKSNCYNPFDYIRSETDIIKLITNLIANTTPKNAQQNDRPAPPDQNGGQQGGQMDENERSGQQTGQQSGQQNGQQGSPPDFGGGEKNPPGMPGQDNKSVRLSDCLPTIAVCGGVFVVGVVVLILFKRKKDLKPPKENKTE